MNVKPNQMKEIINWDYINVCDIQCRENYRHISTRSKWFDCESIIIKDCFDFISITKPSLDYRGKSYSITKQNEWYHFSINMEFPVGKFEIDLEDSNEDELIIYYNK